MDSCTEELDAFYGSENEEEVESESEEIKYAEEEDSEEEHSEDELNSIEEMIKMHDGQCCIFVLRNCVESEFLWEFNTIVQRKCFWRESLEWLDENTGM